MNDLQTLQQMIEEYRDLPYDKARVALNRQALALAEELALPIYRTEVRYAISAAMVAAHVAGELPQIPLEQYRALMEQFHDQVKRYGLGERPWQMHKSYFCLLTGDLKEAEELWDTPRDAISDCEACELGSAAEILLALPRSFPLWQPQYPYDTAELAQWFRDQAEAIAEKFDRRNGSDYFMEKLPPACACKKAAKH